MSQLAIWCHVALGPIRVARSGPETNIAIANPKVSGRTFLVSQ